MNTGKLGTGSEALRMLGNLELVKQLLGGNSPHFGSVAGGQGLVVAVPFDHSGAWAAQTSFLRSVAVCLRWAAAKNRGRIIVINLSGQSGERAVSPDVQEQMVNVERDLWQNSVSRQAVLEALGVRCLLHLFEAPFPPDGSLGVVGWIADFQHFRLPEFFPAPEIRERDEAFQKIISRSDRLMMSSGDAERDCVRFSPQAAGKTRVHRFPSGLVMETLPEDDVRSVIDKYHLPEKFALVANQFWSHKNHAVVIEAVRLAALRGVRIPLVLTGLPADYRDPANAVVSRILQDISRGNLRNHVIPLARVPYGDLIALMRAAAVVVQPSRFEGWSTVVQDAKALGRPLICSGISVHREQAPTAVGFFDPLVPEELAELLMAEWSGLKAGPDRDGEHTAMKAEKSFAEEYGEALWCLCAEVADFRMRFPVRDSTPVAAEEPEFQENPAN